MNHEIRWNQDDSVPNRIGPLVEYVLFDHASGRFYTHISTRIMA